MPTVMPLDGLRIVVYPNDHPPAHVHVLGPGWVVVIELSDLTVREAIGCSERQVARALRLITPRQRELLEFWRRFHA
jgi:hypothetical protein